MGSGLADEEDQEKERGRSKDEKAERKEFGLAVVVDHDGTEMPSSFHPCPSIGYAQFNIRGVVRAYSIHLGIDCSEISTDGIYSTDS
ncbi:hypothetical protein COCNU_07G009940 [Cocos nucifera]|uniref:Uncharacterized protein n=1 Tax=Cocos nucifera TaxID=13894 RepID=A0A8K0IFV3_COCNU|nr:hypothetical protein COCNU_07G009940 [Cocos nucifera]